MCIPQYFGVRFDITQEEFNCAVQLIVMTFGKSHLTPALHDGLHLPMIGFVVVRARHVGSSSRDPTPCAKLGFGFSV